MKWMGAGACLIGIVLFVFLALVPIPTEAGCPAAPQPDLPRSPLTIETKQGVRTFSVEVANSDAEKTCGLMRRQRMARDQGMLFEYSPPGPAFMWMANTFIPLDMLFIAEDGRIAHIERNTEPLSHQSVGTRLPIAGVLEILAGSVERMGIVRGDRVRHRLFGTDQP